MENYEINSFTVCLVFSIIAAIIARYLVILNTKNKKEKEFPKELQGDKFMKILIACEVPYEFLKDYSWSIIESSPHCYHCTGSHPILRRIDIIKKNVVV